LVAPLGAGGMGEVWRARDARLGRDVALKSLPEDFARDPARVGRFDREARLLASLQHPNVAALHGVEEQDGARYLVLECVEGATLGERLATGPLPIDEAIEVSRQIATGVEAAHEHGVIHRDLKPGNIKITPAGEVKVLDFGLAKAAIGDASADLLSSPTLAHTGTAVGVILGTAPYMSPEQARGKVVDRRSDVWSFGCVLFECLTGRVLFAGETVSDVIGRILQTEPDWTALPVATPPRVRELLRRCLARDPKKRLRDIGEARVVLEEIQAGTPEPGTAAPAAVAAAVRPGRERFWMALAALALLTAIALAVMLVRRTKAPPPEAPSLSATIPLPSGLHLDGVGSPVLAVSRDGRTLAFVARGESGPARLYVRGLDSAEVAAVPGSDTAEGPFFSPDGRWVAFAVGVSLVGGQPPELRKYSLETRLTQTICPLEDYFGGAWRKDDSILFVGAHPGGLWTVDARGGVPRLLVERFRQAGRDGVKAMAWPELLPGERTVLLDDWNARARGSIVAVELASGEMKDLGLAGWGARYLPTGHLVYGGAGATLMAVPFDLRTLGATGAPVALASDLAFARNASPALAVSGNGTLVRAAGYLAGSRREPMRLVAGTTSGVTRVLPVDADLYSGSVALSPDGRSLTLGTWDSAVWVIDVLRGTRVKLSAMQTDLRSLRWSADGRSLLLAGALGGELGCGIFRRSVDGTDAIETVVPPVPAECEPAGWSADGRTLFYFVRAMGAGVTFMRLDPGSSPRVAFEGAAGVVGARVSPNGRFLAFESDSSGDYQVYVHALESDGARVTVTRAGGRWPVWARDGRALFFSRDRKIVSVAVETAGAAIRFGAERTVLEWNATREFDVGADGTLYGIEPVPGAAIQTSLQVQTGWFAEVERLAGAGAKR
jgi:serine/threonine-protein kinase